MGEGLFTEWTRRPMSSNRCLTWRWTHLSIVVGEGGCISIGTRKVRGTAVRKRWVTRCRFLVFLCKMQPSLGAPLPSISQVVFCSSLQCPASGVLAFLSDYGSRIFTILASIRGTDSQKVIRFHGIESFLIDAPGEPVLDSHPYLCSNLHAPPPPSLFSHLV